MVRVRVVKNQESRSYDRNETTTFTNGAVHQSYSRVPSRSEELQIPGKKNRSTRLPTSQLFRAAATGHK
jgi:hypothetical protein